LYRKLGCAQSPFTTKLVETGEISFAYARFDSKKDILTLLVVVNKSEIGSVLLLTSVFSRQQDKGIVMWKEFKEFVLKGPVMSLAIGVIIGAAFGKIVDSAVKDLIMPIIGAIFGGKVDFTNMFVVLGHTPDGVPHTYDALTKAGANVFAYGSFITVLVNFVLLALGVFIIIKLVNKLYQEQETDAGPTEDVLLLREIRDSLKK